MKTSLQSVQKAYGLLRRLALALLVMPVVAWASGRYSIDFKVTGYTGTEVLNDFPVLVRLSTDIPHFSYDKCHSNGEDVTFCLPDGTPLAREIDTWNPEGESLIWVRLPELQQGTEFKCEFYDPSITAQPPCQTDGSVWRPSGYIAVWHMNEPNARDSTGLGNDGSAGANVNAEGFIGTAQAFDGTANRMNCGTTLDSAFTAGFSIETWARPEEFPDYQGFCGIADCFSYRLNGNIEICLTTPNIRDHRLTLNPVDAFQANTWYHLVCDFMPDTTGGCVGYVNGVEKKRVDASKISPPAEGVKLELGGNFWNQNFKGRMDEFRTAKAVRSADWNKAVYDTASSAEFLTAGEATRLEGALVIAGVPAAYGTAVPAYGTITGLTNDTEVACSVSAVVTNDAEGMIATCVGWTEYDFDGHETGTGTGNSHTIVFDTFSRLVWSVERQFKVDLQAKGGSITGADVWEPEGQSLTLTAEPDEGMAFVRWTGDFPGAGSRELSVTFAIDRPIKAVAVFRRAAATRYYVATDGDDVNNSGETLDSPFATLAMALSCVQDGDSIEIAAGRYVLAESLVVDKAIAIEGAAGPGEAILTRESGEVVNLLVLKNEKAAVRGLVFDGNRDFDQNLWIPWRSLVKIEKEGGLVEKCVIRNSRTELNQGEGAGIWMSGGILRDCVVSNNCVQSSGGAGKYGGGLAIFGGVAERCFIHGNQSTDGSGALAGGVYAAGGILRNSLITGNIAVSSASGVWVKGGTVENCTIAGNHHNPEYPSVDCEGVCMFNGVLKNCIVYGNWNTSGEMNIKKSQWSQASKFTIDHCCSDVFVEGAPGTGNVIANPQFVDPENGDFHLTSGSCIDAGVNLPWMTADAIDLGGRPRVYNETVDIGCYEFSPTKLVCSFDVENATGLASVEATFTSHVVGTNLNNLVYTWDFNDASGIVTGPDKSVVSHTFGPGWHTVTLKVSNGGETAESVLEACVKVAPETLYVDLNGTSPEAPYATWKTAAATIQDALGVAMAGCTVVVGDGVYELTKPVEILADIDLRSKNGARATTLKIIRPSGVAEDNLPNYNVVYAGDPGVVLDGFTVTGAWRSALNFPKGGTIENCIVRDNKTALNQAEGAGININAKEVEGRGIVRNCLVFHNYTYCSSGAGKRGGGIFAVGGVLVDSCTIVSNFVGDGTVSRGGGIYAEDSTVRDCLIMRNGSEHTSAGVYMVGGAIENCTIVENYCKMKGVTAETHPDYASGIVMGWDWQGKQNATAKNLIIWGNTFADGFVREVYSKGEATINQFLTCLVSNPESVHGEGNFAGDPRFKNSAQGDFHIRTDSPCKNSALLLDWMVPGATDHDGNRRVFEGKPDLGCYENVTYTGTILLVR